MSRCSAATLVRDTLYVIGRSLYIFLTHRDVVTANGRRCTLAPGLGSRRAKGNAHDMKSHYVHWTESAHDYRCSQSGNRGYRPMGVASAGAF